MDHRIVSGKCIKYNVSCDDIVNAMSCQLCGVGAGDGEVQGLPVLCIDMMICM